MLDKEIKELILAIGFVPEDGYNDIYFKKYKKHNNYIIKVDFLGKKIIYRPNDISQNDGIKLGDATTSNFEKSENFVVFECVDRLLEKGYPPKSIFLEKQYPLGRTLKGKLDIVISDNEGKSYLMIECKTWGEYNREYKKMVKDGGQLFSYFANDRTVKFLCLYTSHFADQKVEYKNGIVSVDSEWTELANVKEIHEHWNKNFKDNGIFEAWSKAYDIEVKALVRGRLQPLTKDDSGRIFNQFAEILRHNVVSDKPNAFNKVLNLFICKIIDEDKNEDEQVDFQWLENDTDESLQVRLNDLYKKGMHRFLEIEVTDFSDDEISGQLANINDKAALEAIKNMLTKLRLQKNPEFAFIEVYNDQSFKTNARVVREVVELLQPYQFRYGHKQQFLGDFFELLLNTSIKQESGQFFTPVPICRYIVSALPIKEFITNKINNGDPEVLPAVIDFACGTGHFLTEYMDRVQSIIDCIDIHSAKPSIRKKLNAWRNYEKYDWAKEYVYGIDADYRLVKSSKVSSFLNGDGEANIIRANGLDHFSLSKEYKVRLKEVAKDNPQDNGQFDVLIANPPYSVSAFKSTVKNGEQSFELFDRLTDNSSEIECLFVERMKQLLKVGGYAGIILPSSILCNSGIYTAAREILLKYFKIKGITELGPNTFMATGTNTVILFLERRPNNDHKQIISAIDGFFVHPKEVTVLGIDKAFSKYVNETFDGISLDDYFSFVNRSANNVFKGHENWSDYKNWFYSLPEVVKLQTQKQFKEKTDNEQKAELQNIFYDKVFAIEKEKILYFLLTYQQKTVIVKVGEKQAEKDFLGYEFSNRRGHEGIKMLPGGTKLYDETDSLNPLKASSYIYYAFLNQFVEINEDLEENISIAHTYDMIDFSRYLFDKAISLVAEKRISLNSKYSSEKLLSVCKVINGGTPDTNNPQYWDGDIPWLSVADFSQVTRFVDKAEKSITQSGLKNSNANILQPNDIIISARGTVGALAQLKKPMAFNQSCYGLHANDKVKSGYLFYTLKETVANLRAMATGSKFKSITAEIFEKIKIPCPPLNVQQKIVTEIEAVEETEREKRNNVDSLKSGLIVSNYFEYPTERIEKIAIMVQRGKATLYGKSNIQIIKSGQARGYLKFDFSRRYFVNDSFVVDERKLQKGDILINSTGVGTAGRVTLFDLDGDYVVDSHITIVRLNKDKVLPKYVLYALANIGFKNIEKMANGQSGQVEISLATINGIRIPLPSIEEQKIIVDKIELIEKEIAAIYDEMDGVELKRIQILNKYLN
jgi:Restriction endonuclease S subunits